MNYAEIVDTLTLEEKVRLTSGDGPWHTVGIEEKGIPSIMMTDGPHGLRKQDEKPDGINESKPATCFPAAITSGSTWNRELIERMACAIGEEALAEGISVVLGPGVNIKRNPKCGRNFEYFSEDPFVAGEMAAAYINGMQSTGVSACVKHFAANSQEYKRFNSDSQVDERTLREIYLAAFEIAVIKPRVRTIMAAYPRVNGEFAACNKHLLHDILRYEWGFDGLVMSDWGAMARHVDGIKAGCNLAMPGGSGYEDDVVAHAVQTGELPVSVLDECCRRVVKLALEGAQVRDEHKGATYSIAAHDKIAEEVAADGAVLLKNEWRRCGGKALPIGKYEKVLLVGHMAREVRYQGGGSSHIVPTKMACLADEMTLCIGCKYIEGYDESGAATDEALAQVREAAKKADIVVVVAGLPPNYESEGFDRATLDMPEGINRTVEAAASSCTNTVVVLMAGGVVIMPWLDKVQAVLFAGLCGQAGARAICDILVGRISPSGHLTETWPLSLKDVPSEGQYSVRTKNVEYREGIYVGYRYYDKARVRVAFPFGHGLSYAKIEYTSLQVVKTSSTGYNYTVSVTVKNDSDVEGAEVVQVYVGNPADEVVRANKELRGFEKVYLKPYESKTVEIRLNRRSFCVYDAYCGKWRVPSGEYTIMVGASAQDIRLTYKVEVKGDDADSIASLHGKADSWYVSPTAKGRASRDEWLSLMGSTPLDFDNVSSGKWGMDATMQELSEHSAAVKRFVDEFKAQIAERMGVSADSSDEHYQMAVSCSVDCALHGVVLFGMIPYAMAQALIDKANGKISDEDFYSIANKTGHKTAMA